MEIIILDRVTFEIKDYVHFTNTFDIKLDLVLSQKSTFKLSKLTIKGNIGDVIYFKEQNFHYVGMIESLDDEDGGLVLGSLEFKEILKKEVKVSTYSGNLSDFIESLIRTTFIQNQDNKENIKYLSISKETTKMGELTFEADKIIPISEVIELVSKTYGVSVREEIMINNGKLVGILLRIVNVSSGIKLRGEQLKLSDLVINEASEQVVNKVTFIASDENVIHKDSRSFYLLKDGTISEDAASNQRYDYVNSKTKTYKDKDYDSLITKAQTELSVSRTNHQITFTVPMSHLVVRVFDNINLGDFVEFHYKGKIYDSVVTAINFKDTIKACLITLGEYRLKLTEKIQVLTKTMNSKVGSISINKSGLSDLDGGEF